MNESLVDKGLEPSSERIEMKLIDDSHDSRWYIEWTKYFLSTVAVSLCIEAIFHGIMSGYVVFKLNAAVLCVILISALILLAFVEALHYSNVSVESLDMTPYLSRFPKACKIQRLVNSNEKVQTFLVGRQFFVIFVVFVIAQCTTLADVPNNYLGLPAIAVKVFFGYGLPGVLFTLTFGQLVPQLLVEQYTLPVMNIYGCYCITKLCFFAEYIGICNFSWLLFHSADYLFFSKNILIRDNDEDISNVENTNSIEQTPSTNNLRMEYFDIIKHIWSTTVTLLAICIVGYGVSKQYSVLGLPAPVLFIVLIAALVLLFFLEGLMIAIVATQYNNPADFQSQYPRAFEVHKLVNKPNTVKKFIIGRQFCTLLSNFTLALITSFPSWPCGDVDGILCFIGVKSGLSGVFITLAFAQLLPELLAAKYPLRFMNILGSYSIVRITLFIESIGVGHCAWFIFFAIQNIFCVAIDSARDILSTDFSNKINIYAYDNLGSNND